MPPAPPGSPDWVTWVWWIVVALLIIAAGCIVFLSLKRKEAQAADEKRASAAEALIKVRDIELSDEKKLNAKLTLELADQEAENRVLSGINVRELMAFWKKKTLIEEDLDLTKSELRRVNRTLERIERGEKPTTG